MKSFKELVLEAWKDGSWVADTPPQKTKGSRYSGEEHEKEADAEPVKKPESTETTEKRGRGRPKGAVSQDTKSKEGMAGSELNKILRGEFEKRTIRGLARKVQGWAQSGSRKDEEDDVKESLDESKLLTFKLQHKQHVQSAIAGIGHSSFDDRDGHNIRYDVKDDPKIKQALSKAGMNPFNDTATSSDKVRTRDYEGVGLGLAAKKKADMEKKNAAKRAKTASKKTNEEVELDEAYEGDIHVVKSTPTEVEDKLKLTPGTLDHTANDGRYSAEAKIMHKGKDHIVYSNRGSVRVRALGHRDEATAKSLANHIDGLKEGVQVDENTEKEFASSQGWHDGYHGHPYNSSHVKLVYKNKEHQDAYTKGHKEGVKDKSKDSISESLMRKVIDKLDISAPGTHYHKIAKDIVKDTFSEPKQTAKDAWDLVKKASSAIRSPLKTANARYESVELDESKKKIGEYSNGSNVAKVYKMTGEHDEGDPYVVHLHKNGKHYEPADYGTNDEADAHGTAKSMVK